MSIKEYIVMVKHDGGVARIRVAAHGRAGAASRVMQSERCPRRAILSIRLATRADGWSLVTSAAIVRPDARVAASAATLEEQRKRLMLETLESRGRDALDFHSIGVWMIKSAIEDAFRDGWDARGAAR